MSTEEPWPARTYEAQYDPGRATVTLVATAGFAGDRYAVTVPAASPEEADERAREFVAMYRRIEEPTP